MNNRPIVSNYFGSHDGNRGYPSDLGFLCGVDGPKIVVLGKPDRSLFDRLTDVLLIDPIGWAANYIGSKGNKLVRAYKENRNFVAQCNYAERDIFIRKTATVTCIIPPLLVFLEFIFGDKQYYLEWCAEALRGEALQSCVDRFQHMSINDIIRPLIYTSCMIFALVVAIIYYINRCEEQKHLAQRNR